MLVSQPSTLCLTQIHPGKFADFVIKKSKGRRLVGPSLISATVRTPNVGPDRRRPEPGARELRMATGETGMVELPGV